MLEDDILLQKILRENRVISEAEDTGLRGLLFVSFQKNTLCNLYNSIAQIELCVRARATPVCHR